MADLFAIIAKGFLMVKKQIPYYIGMVNIRGKSVKCIVYDPRVIQYVRIGDGLITVNRKRQ